jgi:membrane protein DedA with SNARE-associated domain
VATLFVIVLLRAGATYAIGRAAHAGAGRTRLRRRLSSPRFARVEQLIGRYGAPVVACSFLTVGFQTVANLAAGLARMPLRRYLPALALGGLAWAVLYAGVGLLGLAALRRLWAWSPVATSIAVLVLAALAAAYVGVQRRRGRRAAAAAESDSVRNRARAGR